MHRVRQLYSDEKTKIYCRENNIPFIEGRERPRAGVYRDISSDESPEFNMEIDFASMQYEQQLKQTSLAGHGKPKKELSEKQWSIQEKTKAKELDDFIVGDQ